MRVPTRHPRLSAVACKVYGLTIWVYRTEFRRAFGHELAVTFRNRVEDVLDGGGLLDWFVFAGHIVIDWVRTCSMLATDSETHVSVSLLGLSAEGDRARGCLDRTNVDVSFVFAVAGLVLGVVGWYTYVATLAYYFG